MQRATTQEARLSLYDLAEEQGQHVRLDRRDEETPSSMHDGRGAAAPIALELDWVTMLSYRACSAKHINFLEIDSLISLIRRVTSERVRAQRLSVLVVSRVVLGAVSKVRSSSIRPHGELLLLLVQKEPAFVPDSGAFDSFVGDGFMIPE